MAKERGWWTLTTTTELNDTDREYIAKLISEGYTEGEVCQDENNESEKNQVYE